MEYKFRQIHVDLPLSLYNHFREVLPEHGMLSIIVRKLIADYCRAVTEKRIDAYTLEQKPQPIATLEEVSLESTTGSEPTDKTA